MSVSLEHKERVLLSTIAEEIKRIRQSQERTALLLSLIASHLGTDRTSKSAA